MDVFAYNPSDVPNAFKGIIPGITQTILKVCHMDVPRKTLDVAGRPMGLGYILK